MNFPLRKEEFGSKYKFSNKNDMGSPWRSFKNIFSRPLFTIIFRPEIIKFHPYSILTGDTMVGFVIFCVLRGFETHPTRYWAILNFSSISSDVLE